MLALDQSSRDKSGATRSPNLRNKLADAYLRHGGVLMLTEDVLEVFGAPDKPGLSAHRLGRVAGALFGTNAEPDAGLALDELSRVAAQNGLKLVVRALLEPRQWVERRHRGHRSCPPL
jgi:hypothetical protein